MEGILKDVKLKKHKVDYTLLESIFSEYKNNGKLVSETVVSEESSYKDGINPMMKTLKHLHNGGTSNKKILKDLEQISDFEKKFLIHQFYTESTDIGTVYFKSLRARLNSHLGHNAYIKSLVQENEDENMYFENIWKADITLFRYPLHLMVECNNRQKADFLLKEKNVDINSRDDNGRTALHWFVLYSDYCRPDYSVIDFLEDGDSFFEKMKRRSGELRNVSDKRHLDMLVWCEENGASIVTRDKNGISPIYYAALTEQTWLVERWLDDRFNLDPLTKILTCELLVAQTFNEEMFVRALEMRSVHALELPLFKSVIPWIIEEPKSITDFKSLVSADSRTNPLLNIFSCRIMERVMGPTSHHFFMAALKLEEKLCWIEEEKDQAFINMTMQFYFFRRQIMINHFEIGLDGISLDHYSRYYSEIILERNIDKISSIDILKFVNLLLIELRFLLEHENKAKKNRLKRDSNICNVHYEDEANDVGKKAILFISYIVSRSLTDNEKIQVQNLLMEISFISRTLPYVTEWLQRTVKQTYSHLLQLNYYISDRKHVEVHGFRYAAWIFILEKLIEYGVTPEDCNEFFNKYPEKFIDAPLNILCKYYRDVQTSVLDDEHGVVKKYLSSELFRMVKLLVKAGAHVDMANFEDETPLQLAKGTSLEPFLLSHRNLQCLAARAVMKHKIPFENILSKDMTEFVRLHY
ncbi:uncharacterized protein LOC134692143 [Mytilus trossulus]|uniref:uncharacterized protein LOC134692143 n=1 Tax=Mytilus trossulus TaxID=6551 RepID=UPI0030071A17